MGLEALAGRGIWSNVSIPGSRCGWLAVAAACGAKAGQGAPGVWQ